MTSAVVGLRRSSKAVPKVKLAPKNSWSLFGGFLPVWSTTAFRILAKPLHLKSMLSKSMRYIENGNTCARHWATEKAQFFPMTMPDHTSPHHQHFKSWTNWATKFCLICHIHVTSCQLTTTSLSIWTIFCREKHFYNQQGAKNAFQEFIKSPSTDFYTTVIKLFLVGKYVLTVMVPILINEDVFEPSYNDLKLMLQNCNYICTSLIVGMSNVTFPRALDLSLQACSPCKSSLHSKCHQHPRVAHIPLGVTLISSFSPSNHTYTCIIHHHPSATHASSHLQNTSCMSLFLTTSNAMIPDTLAWVSAILAAIHTWLFSKLPHLSLFPPPESPK